MAGFLDNIIHKNLQNAPQSTPSLRPRLKSWFEEDASADGAAGAPLDERDLAVEDDMPIAAEHAGRPSLPEPPSTPPRPTLDAAPRSRNLIPQRTPPSPPYPAMPAPDALSGRMARALPTLAPHPVAFRVQRSPVERGITPQPTLAQSTPSPTSAALQPRGERAPRPVNTDEPPAIRPPVGTQRVPVLAPPVPELPADQQNFPSSAEMAESPAAPQPTPTIRVNIGRIEVRATQPAANAQVAPAPSGNAHGQSTRAVPALSLADYLKRRSAARSRTGR